MSSIRKRGKTWFLDLRMGDQRLRESLGTSDKRVAAIKAKLRERELRGPAVFQRSTLEEFRDEYLHWAKPLKSPETIGVEKNALIRFQGIIKAKHLDEVTPRMVDEFISKLASEVKPITINFYVRTLKAIFGVALRWKYIAENPFAETKPLAYELPPVRILSRKELAAIFEVATREFPAYLQLLQFYLCTGLRRSEALRLQWDDVNEEANYLLVKGTKSKSIRYIPLLPQTLQILKSRSKSRAPFAGFTADDVTRTYSKIALAAKVKNTSLHDLRRSFASYLTDMGIPMAFVQKWMGHSFSSDVTQDYYIGLSDDMWQRMRRLDLDLFHQN